MHHALNQRMPVCAKRWRAPFAHVANRKSPPMHRSASPNPSQLRIHFRRGPINLEKAATAVTDEVYREL